MAILTGANFYPQQAPTIVTGGMGQGYGCNNDGFGNGGISALLLASMLGGRGFGPYNQGYTHGGGECHSIQKDCVTSADLNSQTLGDIKASIPLAEGQVQLALAGLQASLTGQANASTQFLSTGQTAIQLAQANIAANLARDVGAVDTNVDRQSCAIQSAIHSDGEATRALITSNMIAELNQRLTVAQQEALELRQRNDRDRDRHGIEITMNNNQNQLQQQQQLQFQAINHQMQQLCGFINQRNYATNSTVQVGNTGAATAGPQNNNPTNVVA